ncbi:hypothetical protein GCM10011349_38590 [Novosphingobium indicum]|uniref:Transposase n=1 Tax=Novosphingobium indicum TaxID=462949 RepID=A0ABQ2JXY7_9SPHN|nr:hypothetical protein GCM10011349_38590 [Novosphingobium indicum]
MTFKRVKGADAGTGYDGVEPSHRLHSLRDKACVYGVSGQIRRKVHIALHIGREHLCAVRKQLCRDSSAYARSGTGNDGTAAMQPAAHAIFSTSLPVLAPVNSRMKAG